MKFMRTGKLEGDILENIISLKFKKKRATLKYLKIKHKSFVQIFSSMVYMG